MDTLHAQFCQIRVLVWSDSLPLLREEECKHTQTNAPPHASLPLFNLSLNYIIQKKTYRWRWCSNVNILLFVSFTT